MSDQFEGTMRELGGKAEDAAGRVAGDTTLQGKGVADQVSGAVQRNYGAVRDVANDGLETLSETIRDQPLTAIVVALGVGWLLGRLRVV
ncbi:MAG: CsbD family protein [Acetobacteraceae bacterium]|nr:CsbD family protein [Acetobacteraceae bacterium]